MIQFSDQPGLIESIQELRKYQLRPEQPSLESRLKCLENLCEVLAQPQEGWIKAVAQETDVPETCVRNAEFAGFAAGLSRELSLFRTGRDLVPTGLISILSPRVFPLRTTLERLVPAYLAGDPCIVKFSSRTSSAKQIFMDVLAEAKLDVEGMAVTSAPSEQLLPVLTAHPSIRGVSFVGSLKTAGEIQDLLQHFCRFQAWTGGITSWLCLSADDLERVAQELRLLAVKWGYNHPYFPKKIFVLESFAEKARSVLQELWPLLPGSQVSVSGLVAKMTSEGAKVRYEGSPALVEDLPHCSEFHQLEIAEPVVQLVAVKYIHEMVKWINTGSYGLLAQIWGPAEKAVKLAPKIECGLVTINEALQADQSLLFGMKESALGINDLTPEGCFFSQKRTVIMEIQGGSDFVSK
ncbi:MAG: hypothetical protein C5B49_02795 [Bdellovibrio sp.]|nr:MAG: hypothetical protein C5B49_02795 [Bdellovibrio sp.]